MRRVFLVLIRFAIPSELSTTHYFKQVLQRNASRLCIKGKGDCLLT